MRRLFRQWICGKWVGAIIFMLCFGSPLLAQTPTRWISRGDTDENPCLEAPFAVGEEARFAVFFGALKVGEVKGTLGLKAAPPPEIALTASAPSGDLWHFSGRAQSSKLISMFYRVDDRLQTWMNRETLLPHRQEMIVQETNERGTRRVLYDHPAGVAHFLRDRTFYRGKDPSVRIREDALLPNAFDTVSLFFHLRCFEAEVGELLVVPVHENGKNREVKIKVVRKGVIKTPLGKRDAIEVRVRIFFEGKLSTKQAFRVWVSNDEHKVPLRFVADFAFANLKGILVGYRPHREGKVEGVL